MEAWPYFFSRLPGIPLLFLKIPGAFRKNMEEN